MAYRTFETSNATYILGLMNHGFKRNLIDGLKRGGSSHIHGLEMTLFDNIDGLVIEEAGGGIEMVLYHYWDAAERFFNETCDVEKLIAGLITIGDPRHLILARTLMKIPIYSVDVSFGNMKEDIEREVTRRFNSHLDNAFHGWMKRDVSKEICSMSELSGVTQWLAQFGFYLEGDPNIEGRNAINAEKIERWVVPRVVEYSGKSKPTIGLVYGGYHLGIEQNLKSLRRRNNVLRRMQHFNGWHVGDFNLAQEARYNPGTEIVEIREFDTDVLSDL